MDLRMQSDTAHHYKRSSYPTLSRWLNSRQGAGGDWDIRISIFQIASTHSYIQCHQEDSWDRIQRLLKSNECAVLWQNREVHGLRGDAGLVESGCTWKLIEHVLLLGAMQHTWAFWTCPSSELAGQYYGMLRSIPAISAKGLNAHFDIIDSNLVCMKVWVKVPCCWN